MALSGIFCHFTFDKERNGESSLLEDIWWYMKNESQLLDIIKRKENQEKCVGPLFLINTGVVIQSRHVFPNYIIVSDFSHFCT